MFLLCQRQKLEMKNTLAYLSETSMMEKRSFITLTPGSIVIKLFRIIYNIITTTLTTGKDNQGQTL
jgi:hypothetical protein